MITTTTNCGKKNVFKASINEYKKFLCSGIIILLLAFTSNNVLSQVSGDFRSTASGTWATSTTWQRYNGTTWDNSGAGSNNPGQVPSSTSSVWIQTAHVVTLGANASCNDLHIASSTNATPSATTLGKIALATFTLSVNGKLRNYFGTLNTIPGSNQANGFSIYPFTTSTGKVSIVGTTRTVLVSGEWGATITTPTTGAFPLEVNLSSNTDIATFATNIKCTSFSLTTGTVTGVTISMDNGTTGQGDVTISSGTTLISSATSNAVFQRSGSTRAGTLTLAGTLELTGTTPQFAMNALSITGTVKYSRSGAQTFIAAISSGTSLSSYANIIISGSGVKTLALASSASGTTTVNSGCTMATGAFTFTNNGTANINGSFQLDQGGWGGNTGTYNYGSTGTLVFNNSSGLYGVNSGDTWWPTSNGPINVTVQNGGGIQMNVARTVPSSGTSGVFLLVTGTNAVQGTALTLNGTTQINGGNFQTTPTYGSASTLVYNTTYGTSNEWTGGASTSVTAGSGVPANVQVLSGTVTLAGGRGVPGNVTVTAGGLVLNATSGDLYLGGNLTHSGTTWTNNSRAVVFVGTGTSVINTSANSGVQFFDYFLISKSSGSVQLGSTTNVTLNTTSGDVLQFLDAGTLDLNGRTLTFNNSGGNILVNGATGGTAKSITSSSAATIAITNNKTASGSNGGTLSFDANITVLLTGGMNFGGISTLNGTLQINAGGFVTTNAPIYGSGSTLIYNATTYGRGTEWSATTGAGYPFNVKIGNGVNTSFDVVNGSNSYKKAAGNLTVSNGSTFSIPSLTSGSGNVGVEFLGNIVNDGTITLSGTTNQRLKAVSLTNGNSNSTATVTLASNVGGDLELTGNYVDNAVFTANARAVFFTGAGTQTISGTASAPFNIDYIVSNKASGSIQLGVDLLTAGPNGGNAITLTSSSDIFDLNGKTFTLGTSGVASTIAGSGVFLGGGTSKMIFNGSGAFGTVRFDQTTPGTSDLLSNLTVNRTSTGDITLGSNLSISADATLTAGTINIGANNMTIGASATITVSSPDATKMIIASSTGQLRKIFTGTGSFLYPVGDNVSTVEYSPITIDFTAGSFSSAYAGVNLSNSKQGSNASATDYINRFWTISASGITSPTYTATAVYADGDIAGTEGNLYGGLYAASTWNCMGPVTTASNTISSSLTQFGDITAGDVESMGCCINPALGGGIDADQTICSGGDPAAFTSTSLPSGHTGTLEYQWQSSTTSAVAGFSDISGANSTTYDIPSGLTATTWYKRLARVTCKTSWAGAASSNVLQITVNQPPTTSAAGADQNGSGTCGLTTVTLAANSPSVGVGSWSIISGAGGSFSDASDESSDFSGTAGTTYTLRWTITNAPCAASTDDVDITFNINPTTSNAGSAISICSIGVASLSANTPTNGSGVWSITSGPSSNLSQFSNTASPTSTFTPDGGTGSYVLTWTISNSPCTASSSNVTVTVVSGTAGEWIGGISTDWADVNNWCGSVPNSSTDVIIPNGAAFYPIITSGTEAAKSISIASAASLQVNGGSLTLASSGDVANAGTLTVGSSGTLDMVNNQITGTGTVTINGTFSTTKSSGFSGGASTAIANTLTSVTLGSASTIDYSSSSSQTITVENYANLSNSGNGSRTFPTGTVGISGTFTTGSGDYTIGNSTVTFNGSSAQSIPAPTVSSGGNYNNLTLNNTAGATLSANTSIKGSLTLTNGAFDVNGKIFTLLSTATQTARIAAITGGSYVGDVTVERYVPAGPTGWSTIGMPVTGATLAQWNDDIATSGYTGSTYGAGIFHSVYTYDETVGGLASAAASYVTATNSTNSVDGKRGYFVYLDVSGTTMSAKTLDVTGPPLTGNQDMNVTFSPSGGTAEDGWNLVNNPYCSTIDWLSPAWSKTNMDNAIYIYNADNNQYVGKAGGVSYNGGNEFIGSSQSFMVHANANSPFLQATEDVKTATNAIFYKASSVTTGVLRLQLDGLNGTYNDETVFHVASGATSNFDADFDAYKLYSFDPAAPNISSKMNGIEYVVNTVDNLVSNLDLPVRVNVNTPGSYTINFIGLQEFANLSCFSLEDKLSNTWVDLKIDSTYTFTSQIDTASANPRFMLHFGVETIVPQISPSATTLSIPGSTSVDFTNLTSGATSYSWDFGDGSPVENTVSPSHTFSAVGVYTVTLTASNTAGCSQTSTVLITVDDVTGINTAAAEESILIGKDAQGVYANYNFKNSTLVKLSIYNALGEQIGLTKNKTVQSKGQFYVETSGLAKGVYTIELLVNNKKITRKMIF